MTHYLAFALGMFVTTLLFFAGFTLASRRDQRAQAAALTPSADTQPSNFGSDQLGKGAGALNHGKVTSRD